MEFLQKGGIIETMKLYFIIILPLLLDKCSIKTSVRKVYELRLQPSYYQRHDCDTETEVLLSLGTNESFTKRDTDPVTPTTYYQEHDCDTDTEVMLSRKTNVSPTDRETDPVTSTTCYQP